MVPGFSRGVNDSLLAAATLVHFKAAALLGFALTVSGVVVTQKPDTPLAGVFQFSGVVFLISSACFSGAVIFPKKSTRSGGLIFWGDIALHDSAEAYAEKVRGLASADDVEREYEYTNFRLSGVLVKKYDLIRGALVLLLLGASLAGAGLVLR